MKTALTFALSPVLWLLASLTTPSLTAQEIGAEAPPKPTTVSIEFGGGTLAEFLAQLKSENAHVNVMASKVVEQVDLPAFEVRDADPYSVLKAVSRIVPAPYHMEAEEIRNMGATVFAVRVIEAQQGGPMTPTPRVSVFSMRQMSGPGKLEPALSAIDAGLSVAKGPKPTVRYHEGTGLLFVNGTQDQLNLVQQILAVIATEPWSDARDKADGKQRSGEGR